MRYVVSAFADEAAADLGEQIRICRKNGIKYIEMRGVDGKNIGEMTIGEIKEIKKRLDAEGFRVSAVGSPYGKINAGEAFTPHLQAFKRTVEAARILGAGFMRVFSFYIPENRDPDAFLDTVTERIGLFLDNADGVTLCHENEKGIYGESPGRCKRLYDAFSGRLKLVFDPANFLQCGYDPATAYALLEQGISYFHIKDFSRTRKTVVPAGLGDGGIGRILAAYAARDGEVFLSLEPHLKVFGGFEKLEAGGWIEGFSYPSNEAAFGAAASALRTLLSDNGFVLEYDMEMGSVWTR